MAKRKRFFPTKARVKAKSFPTRESPKLPMRESPKLPMTQPLSAVESLMAEALSFPALLTLKIC